MAPSSPWVVQSPAERRAPGDADVLVAIPPAGAGASYFAGWGHALPSRLELWPVELPGRNTRSREPKPTVRGAQPG
jgi:medium-chain acyl-[acyl-carrier-protein] hydrolase